MRETKPIYDIDGEALNAQEQTDLTQFEEDIKEMEQCTNQAVLNGITTISCKLGHWTVDDALLEKKGGMELLNSAYKYFFMHKERGTYKQLLMPYYQKRLAEKLISVAHEFRTGDSDEWKDEADMIRAALSCVIHDYYNNEQPDIIVVVKNGELLIKHPKQCDSFNTLPNPTSTSE